MDFKELIGKALKGAVSGGSVLALVTLLPFSAEVKGAIGVLASVAIHALTNLYAQKTA